MNQNQLREYLFQQDLAYEKQMDRLIKDAQPKKINEDYKIKLMKAPIITRDLIGPEYMAERQLLDLSLDLQMQNTIKQPCMHFVIKNLKQLKVQLLKK